MKNLTNKQKVEEVEELFAKIKALFPRCSLMVHEVNMENLPEGFTVEASYIGEEKRTFLTAENIKYRGLTLFD